MARYNKKRARELKHDAFRDATMGAFDRLGDKLAGKGRTIIYAIAALLALAVFAGLYSMWSGRKADEARRALGKAIEIAEAPVSPSPLPGATTPSFTTEKERAEKAAQEFQAVAEKYGEPYRDLARYFAATNMLSVDPARGASELEAISKSGNNEVSARAKFALAQARERKESTTRRRLSITSWRKKSLRRLPPTRSACVSRRSTISRGKRMRRRTSSSAWSKPGAKPRAKTANPSHKPPRCASRAETGIREPDPLRPTPARTTLRRSAVLRG